MLLGSLRAALSFAVLVTLYVRSAAFNGYLPPSVGPNKPSEKTTDCPLPTTSTVVKTISLTEVVTQQETFTIQVPKIIEETVTSKNTKTIYKDAPFPTNAEVSTTVVLQTDVWRRVLNTTNIGGGAVWTTNTITLSPTTTFVNEKTVTLTSTKVERQSSEANPTVTSTDVSSTVITKTVTVTDHTVRPLGVVTEWLTATHNKHIERVVVPPTETITITQTKFMVDTIRSTVPAMTMTQTKTITRTKTEWTRNLIDGFNIQTQAGIIETTITKKRFINDAQKSTITLYHTVLDHRSQTLNETVVSTIVQTVQKPLFVTKFHVKPGAVHTIKENVEQTVFVHFKGEDLTTSNRDKIMILDGLDINKLAIYSNIEHATVSNGLPCLTSYSYQEPTMRLEYAK